MSQFNSNKKNKFKTQDYAIRIIGFLFLIFIVFLISRFFIKSNNINAPVFYIDTIDANLMTRSSLIKKVNELNSVIDSYNAKISRLDLLENENAKLKKELGRSSSSTGVLANVLTMPKRSIYDTFIIDIGADHGIHKGMTVYAFDSIALGTIAEVYDNKSLVSLFSQSGRETVGNVNGSDMNITLIGRGAGEYEVRMPRDISFAVGDKISYQSIETVVLAEIQKIMTDPRDPFQKLLAKTPINLINLKWVIVK